MPDKLDDDEQEELFEMLDRGMSPGDIADELGISERTVYNYKDEWEEMQELRKRVSGDSGVSKQDVVQKAGNIPGLGDQVKKALDQAVEMRPQVLNDPNELYRLVNQVSDLDAYWIDFLVKSVFPNMEAPDNPGQGGPGGPQYVGGRGNQQGPSPPPQYPSPSGGGQQGGRTQPQQGAPYGGQQGGQYGGQQGAPPQGQQPARDPRVDELQETVEELTSVVQEMAQQDDEDTGETEYITIEQDDGSQLKMPVDDPRVDRLLEEEDEDMFETLVKLKESGLIITPDQLQAMQSDDEAKDSIAEAMEAMGERQAQAQQQMSQNFAKAIESLKEKEEEEEDLTLEDVEEVIEDKLTKDETEKLREEMDEKFGEVLDRVEKRSRRQPAEQDPEFLKADREFDFREQQMEMLNKNIQTLPGEVAESIRDGLVPALKEIQHSTGGSPLWSPPGQEGRGQPEYAPEAVRNQGRGEVERRGRRDQRRDEQRRGVGEQGDRYPDQGGREQQRQEQQQQQQQEQQSQMAQDEPEGVSREDAEEIRHKLNLDDDETGGGEVAS